MKHYLPLFFLFLFFQSKAQLPNYDLERNPDPYRVRYDKINIPPIKLDTTYYPFYNDVQMIKIAAHLDSYHNPTFFRTDDFFDVGSVFPIYIFRNQSGKVIKKYNLCGREVEYSKLRQVKDIEKYEAHNFRFKVTQSHEQKKWGKLGAYPIYVKNENSTESFGTFCGLIDSLGNVVLEPVYEKIEWKDSIYRVQQNGKFGLIADDYTSITPIYYDYIDFENIRQNGFIVMRDQNYGMINAKGKVLIPTQYKHIAKSKYRPDKYEVYDGFHWQFYDFKKQYLSQAKFNTQNVRYRDDQLLVYDNGWIMTDTNGNVLCKSENEITEMVNENRFITTRFKDGYHRQIVDRNGTPVHDKEYYYLNKLNSTTLLGAYGVDYKRGEYNRPKHYVLLNADGEPKSDGIYDSFEKLTDNYFQIWQNKKGRIVNERGITMINLEFVSIGKMQNNYFLMRHENNKVRFLYLNEAIRVSDEYDETTGYRNGMLSVKKGDKWGFLDSAFQEVIPFKYDRVGYFSDGLVNVVFEGHNCVINRKGENISKLDLDNQYALKDGFVKVDNDGKTGLMNKSGLITVPLEYDFLGDLIKGGDQYFLIAKKNNYYGIINERNEIIHPFIFEKASELGVHVSPEFNRSKGFYAFCTIEKRNHWEYYYFNFDDSKSYMKTGENFSKGFKKIANIDCENCSGRKFGIKNWDGETVIPIQYDYINDFKNHTFQVGVIGKGGGLIDTTGKVLIPVAYKYIYDMGYGSDLIRVGRYQGPWGLYDYSGKMIADTMYGHFEKPIFDLIPFHANYNYHFVKGEGWQHGPKRMGLMDRNGKIILEAHYDDIQMRNEKKGEILVRRGQDYAILDKEGKLKEGKFFSGKEEEYIPTVPKPKTKRQLRKEKRKSKKKKQVRWL